MLGGVKMGSGTTGKLGRAWHRCMAFLAGPAGPCMVHGIGAFFAKFCLLWESRGHFLNNKLHICLHILRGYL